LVNFPVEKKKRNEKMMLQQSEEFIILGEIFNLKSDMNSIQKKLDVDLEVGLADVAEFLFLATEQVLREV
jgi:hypothetical protein